MKVDELIGAELDYQVAMAEGTRLVTERGGVALVSRVGNLVLIDTGYAYDVAKRYSPSTDWAQGGPIIERERIFVMVDGDGWLAFIDPDFDMRNGGTFKPQSSGPTLLIAAMRAYVASKQ